LLGRHFPAVKFARLMSSGQMSFGLMSLRAYVFQKNVFRANVTEG
jgi:hypothetical protein